MMKRANEKEKRFVVVAAIYIGTNWSSYAYSYRGGEIVYSKFIHEEGESVKTPTNVVLHPNGRLHTFGYEAEMSMASISTDEKQTGFRLFRCFNGSTFRIKRIESDITVDDIQGKPLSALKIFSMAIRYLFDHLLEKLPNVVKSDVKVALIIPADWEDGGRQFMGNAAKEAGISDENIALTSESEAVCYSVHLDDFEMTTEPKGIMHIVAGLWGHTADITVQAIYDTGQIEKHEHGCRVLRNMFTYGYLHTFLEDMLGHDVLEQFRKINPKEYFEFLFEIENKFRSKVFMSSDTVKLPLPKSLQELVNAIKKVSLVTQNYLEFDKLCLYASDVKAWFYAPTVRISRYISKLMSAESMKGVKATLLVGKFMESSIVKEILDKEIPGLKIYPEDVETAALKGALTKLKSLDINEQALVVAAFDIGTTCSGYAYSFCTDKENVITNNWQICESSTKVSHKTSTTVLLDANRKFHSFGYEAEENFAQRALEGKHIDWMLFRHFKRILHKTEIISKDMNVKDLNGDEFNALEIFAMTFEYLHDHMMKEIQTKGLDIRKEEFKYVVTVPAIWDEKGKQFMRQAAIKAGIDGKRLTLSSEPEVAAIWCTRRMKVPRPVFLPGFKYMVIDVGGGTTDVTVNEILPSGKIKVIYKPNGGPWGGVCVDDAFLQYLETKLGNTIIEAFKKEHLSDYFDLLRTFEAKKRANILRLEFLYIPLPHSLREMIDMNTQSNEITLVSDKLKVDKSDVKAWFDNPLTPISAHISELVREQSNQDVSTVFLVGGFCESDHVQKELKEVLSQRDINVIVPNEPSMAVVQGAVLFGRNPEIIASRVMAYTYGISVYKEFDSKIHDQHRMKMRNGKKMVPQCFEIFVRANEEIAVGHRIYHQTKSTGGVPVIRIYRTFEKNPKYTDTGCELIGTLKTRDTHSIKPSSTDEELFTVIFMFGDTELNVKSINRSSGMSECLAIDRL